MKIYNQINNETEDYEMLAEFPFNSDRKRMTLVVRFNNEIIILTKGADMKMLPLINWEGREAEKIAIEKDLMEFALQGLRTLVVAQKTLTEAAYDIFNARLQKLKTSTGAFKELQLNNFYDEYECGLTYAGSTAVEDKLQYGVPETIAMLIEAEIKLWVLTGDKQETAIEIGKSCKLIQPDMHVEILTSEKKSIVQRKLKELVVKYKIDLKLEKKHFKNVAEMAK